MKLIQQKSKRGKKAKIKGNVPVLTRGEYESLGLNSRLALIQALIPLGLMAAAEELQNEVAALAGGYYERKHEGNALYRYGSNPGTVKLAGQKVPIIVPRVRSNEEEVKLKSYELLHRGTEVDETLFKRVLHGISCRNYEEAAEAIPGAIGVSKSTVSKQFVEASTVKLKEFHDRDLSGLDIVAIFLDGKTFSDDEMVIALGVTMKGKKVIIGFTQTDTENHKAVAEFLRTLTDRGLDASLGILTIIDGSKGFRKAIKKVFGKFAFIQRCQWHKRENVVSHLSKREQRRYRKNLQKAYQQSTYDDANKALMKIRKELSLRNQSAVASLDEGLEETLTLHSLGVFHLIGISFKTTNCIESINSLVEDKCARVDYWKNSNQKHRWLASALLDIEPRLRRVMGYKHLPLLREAMMKKLKLQPKDRELAA